jgi:hypothetical protein
MNENKINAEPFLKTGNNHKPGESDDQSKEYAALQAMDPLVIIDTDKPRPKDESILSIDGQSTAALGGITTTLGKAKSRKTHYNTYQAAAFLRGSLGNHSTTLPEGKSIVLFFDTEQSEGEAYDAAKKIRDLAGCNVDKLIYCSLRPYTPKQRRDYIDYKISHTVGVGVVFIDGVRDLVKNINDPNEATDALTDLLKWSGDFKIHIFCTLHLNKSDNNARGHLGTELINKSQTIINIEKSPDDLPYSIVSFVDGRGKGFKEYALGYDEKNLPITMDIDNIRPEKIKPGKKACTPDGIKLNDHCKRLEKIIPIAGLKYSELSMAIMEGYGIKKTKTESEFIPYLGQELGLLEKREGKYYYVSPHNAKDMSRYKESVNDDLPF